MPGRSSAKVSTPVPLDPPPPRLAIEHVQDVRLKDEGVLDLLVQDVEGTAHEVTLPFAVLAQVFDRVAARSELALSVTTEAGGRQLELPVAAWRLVPTVRDGQAQLTCRVPDGSGVDLAFTWNPVTGVRRLGLSVDV